MARQVIRNTENNFRSGLITEATGLNFPENSCTETYDCIFNLDGSVERRTGFDFEASSVARNIDRTNMAIATYLWRNVGGDGNLTLLVQQTGSTVRFYKTTGGSISAGLVNTSVTLTAVSGAPDPATVEAQFCDGNGLLFITHPYCEPVRVSYNTTTDTATPTDIIIKIRDFEGAVGDSLGISERPTSNLAGISEEHEYNLYNQGWTLTQLTAWDTAQTTMPSNADVMWLFKNATDDFDFSSSSITRHTLGNTPAPKGHFILTLSNQDRDTAAGTTGVADTTSGVARPSTSAFFAGRVFYAGINHVGFNSNIYFTQIVERPEQYAFCYQVNDPTSDHLFDLLPSDGGVISIPEAGTVYKLIPIPGGLAVFAANGVWFVTGSTGLGFTAVDYTVQKISSIKTLSHKTFVDVGGFPSWWNADGIYIVSPQGTGLPSVQSITESKIKTFFQSIPLTSKRDARGYFNSVEGVVQWLYRSTSGTSTDEMYNFDRILNFNVNTNSFYPWRITPSDVKVNSIFVLDSISGNTIVADVVDESSDNVVDSSGNQVISFLLEGSSEETKFKYLVSFVDDEGDWMFTFAETRDNNFIDWFQYDLTGENFESYFITGYKLRGSGLNKFQSNWLNVFSKTVEAVSYGFQGIWDYATTGSGTGKWSNKQIVTHTNTNFSTRTRKLKVRGIGLSLQFKVTSIEGEPFHIIGWSTQDGVNTLP